MLGTKMLVSLLLIGNARASVLGNWEAHGQVVDAAVLARPALSEETYAAIEPTTWRKTRDNRFVAQNMTLGEVQKLMGVLRDVEGAFTLPARLFTEAELDAVPDSFDWRDDPLAQTTCPSITEIRDQANCGSCWAFGTSEAMTDRLCIQSNGTLAAHLSAQDVTSCCHLADLGCNGGVPPSVYTYYETEGVVSGGNYGDASGCYAYELAPCAHHVDSPDYAPCDDGFTRTPSCARACDDPTRLDWSDAKIKGGRGYSVCSKDDAGSARADGTSTCAQKMAAEIVANGPITAQYFVHEDFLSYAGGVYEATKHSRMLGGHAIKILGFGTEDDVPYWLVANSWNEEWGMDGFFKIKRGSNECQIEDPVINGGPAAGMAKLAAKRFAVGIVEPSPATTMLA